MEDITKIYLVDGVEIRGLDWCKINWLATFPHDIFRRMMSVVFSGLGSHVFFDEVKKDLYVRTISLGYFEGIVSQFIEHSKPKFLRRTMTGGDGTFY